MSLARPPTEVHDPQVQVVVDPHPATFEGSVLAERQPESSRHLNFSQTEPLEVGGKVDR